MQTVETQNEGLKRAYRMTITAKDVESRIDAEVKKIAPQVRMPGFRPGKVPANLVKKMHKDSLLQDALNSSIQDGVQKAIADNKLRPATQPHVHLDNDYAPGKDAVVDFHLEILPAIAAPAIDGITLERLTVEVSDAQVDESILKLAAGQKSFEAADKKYAAKMGDSVVIDFEGKVDGVPFDGGTPGKYRIFGQVDPLVGIGVCYCMGSVTFEAEAGKITDLGTMDLDLANSGPAEKGDSSSPRVAAYALALEPVNDLTPVDPRLKSLPRISADLRAAGKMANYMGIAISRLPAIKGVLSYQRDRIIDKKAVATEAEIAPAATPAEQPAATQ